MSLVKLRINKTRIYQLLQTRKMSYTESQVDYTVAALGGVVFAIFKPVLKTLKYILSTNPYAIDWAETFQVGWKAFVGAVIGLAVKWVWDKIVYTKKRRSSK